MSRADYIDSPYGRAVKEWKGKTPDSMPPEKVRTRIFDRHNGICHLTGRKIRAGEKWQADHIIPIIQGGENRERNMAPALEDKHREKTKAETAEKSLVFRKRSKVIGAHRPKSIMPGSRNSKFKKHMDRSVSLR